MTVMPGERESATANTFQVRFESAEVGGVVKTYTRPAMAPTISRVRHDVINNAKAKQKSRQQVFTQPVMRR
jgi:hypothetical protein